MKKSFSLSLGRVPPEVFKSVIELPFPKSIRHMPHVAVQVTFHPIKKGV